MEKLTKKIEFVGDKLNASNFTTEFRIASYKTKDGSKFDQIGRASCRERVCLYV